jgi:uncharacterized membrane protein YozB (DUF420 family)
LNERAAAPIASPVHGHHFMIQLLPHIDALLNLIATVLLVTGFILIKQRREVAHRRTMLACFGVSIVFLACYLTYHLNVRSKKFPAEDYADWIRWLYYVILASHVVLAAMVPVLASITIFLGLTDRRSAHRRLARWTFPIWLYVSITGVAVYLMLYWWFPPKSPGG